MGIKEIFFNKNKDTYDNFPDAVIVLDFMRNIIIWNKKAEILFGFSGNEMKNKNIKEIFEDFERFNKIIGLNHGNILQATTQTGEKIFVDVTAYDAYNSAKTVVSIRALSNKFLALQSLLDDYQATRNLVRNRDSFLSNLKFDFINPVNASIGFSQSLLDKVCGDINEKQEKYLNIINSNNKKVKILLDKVFEIISLDADTKEIHFKNFDYTKIVEFAVENHKNAAQDKNIKIVTDIQTTKHTAYNDEYAIAEVLEILIDNAIKFSSNSQIIVNIKHPTVETLAANDIKSPTGYDEKSYLQVSVIDNGSGISEEKATEIFDEYSAKNLTNAQKHDGTALSLPIARKLIHKLGGALWYEPNITQGSIFNFIIPVARMNFE